MQFKFFLRGPDKVVREISNNPVGVGLYVGSVGDESLKSIPLPLLVELQVQFHG